MFSVNLVDFIDWWKMLERSWKSLCFILFPSVSIRFPSSKENISHSRIAVPKTLSWLEDQKADALLCPDPHLTSMLFAAHGDIHWRDDSALYFFFGNQHRNWTYGIITQHYAHTQHYTPALSCRFTCMCLNTFDSRLKAGLNAPVALA